MSITGTFLFFLLQGWSFQMGSAYQFHSWRVFVLVCAFPSVFAIGALTTMPESPRFYLEVRRSNLKWTWILPIQDKFTGSCDKLTPSAGAFTTRTMWISKYLVWKNGGPTPLPPIMQCWVPEQSVPRPAHYAHIRVELTQGFSSWLCLLNGSAGKQMAVCTKNSSGAKITLLRFSQPLRSKITCRTFQRSDIFVWWWFRCMSGTDHLQPNILFYIWFSSILTKEVYELSNIRVEDIILFEIKRF